MTELKVFLTSLYDSLSEAELQALRHGQLRLAELAKSGAFPEDVSVPVYHATDVEITLDVGLEAKQTDDGMEIHVTESPPESGTTLSFSVELYDLLDRRDLEDVDYDDLFPGDDGPPVKPPEDPPSKSPPEDEIERGEGIARIESVQVGPLQRTPRWYQDGEETPGAVRIFADRDAVEASGLVDVVGDRADVVSTLAAKTNFERARLVWIDSVGPNACHDTVDISAFALEDDTLVGSATAVDTSGPDEACAEVITYPSVLARVTFDESPPDAARVSITDGWGDEAVVGAKGPTAEGPDDGTNEDEPDDGANEDEPDDRQGGRPSIRPVDIIRDRDIPGPEAPQSRRSEAVREILGREPEELSTDRPVEAVDGIGPSYGGRLRENGIETLAELIATPPEEIAEHASAGNHRVSAERAERWIEVAVRELESDNSDENDRQRSNE